MNKDIKWFELSRCFIFGQGFPWQSSFPQPRGARAVGECSRPPPENAGMVQPSKWDFFLLSYKSCCILCCSENKAVVYFLYYCEQNAVERPKPAIAVVVCLSVRSDFSTLPVSLSPVTSTDNINIKMFHKDKAIVKKYIYINDIIIIIALDN